MTENNLADELKKDEKYLNGILHLDKKAVHDELLHILVFYFSKNPQTAIKQDWLHALTILVRGWTFFKMNVMKKHEKNSQPKFINYLSMEFLIGRTLHKSMDALGVFDIVEDILKDHGLSFADLEDIEPEPGLGNGGLGRLAACFMDSMAALEIPTFGYGLRYEYGMFSQKIIAGQQIEVPDMWLLNGYMWEIHHPEIKYLVPFANNVDSNGKQNQIYAQAYDILIPVANSSQISRIRLWAASTNEELVLDSFNVGDYARAFSEKNNAENISSVLYPDDRSEQGKELRLKQEYFFSSASIQDVLFRFVKNSNDFSKLPEHQAVHLNDTHPALAIPEFIRIITKHYFVSWDEAWGLATNIFSYTNHTLLPEALEKWDVHLFEVMLPDVLKIIYQINYEFLNLVRNHKNKDGDFVSRVSLIDESDGKKIRMANLSILASKKINGVSVLHSDLMITSIFKDFYELFPDRFLNVTNGVTQRRWLQRANPGLSNFISSKIGDGWKKVFSKIEQLADFANDNSAQNEFLAVKRQNKERLAKYLKENYGFELNVDSLFDSQIKRIHEYKRQHLNVLHILHRYNEIIANPGKSFVPRTFLISGKAASAYYMAKLLIRFINDVAKTINNDPRTNKYLNLFFVPDYSVRIAELIIPATDVSEQISTAGLEASGTGNMKLSMNGALTIGTYDGANIEIMEAVGQENFFLFGKRVEELQEIKNNGYNSKAIYENNVALKKIINEISVGLFSPDDTKRYKDLVNNLIYTDNFMVFADFDNYIKVQGDIDSLYQNKNEWARKAIINVAKVSSFSSDVSIKKYASEIWNVNTAY